MANAAAGNDEFTEEVGENNVVVAERLFNCQYCNHVFCSSRALAGHYKMHRNKWSPPQQRQRWQQTQPPSVQPPPPPVVVQPPALHLIIQPLIRPPLLPLQYVPLLQHAVLSRSPRQLQYSPQMLHQFPNNHILHYHHPPQTTFAPSHYSNSIVNWNPYPTYNLTANYNFGRSMENSRSSYPNGGGLNMGRYGGGSSSNGNTQVLGGRGDESNDEELDLTLRL